MGRKKSNQVEAPADAAADSKSIEVLQKRLDAARAEFKKVDDRYDAKPEARAAALDRLREAEGELDAARVRAMPPPPPSAGGRGRLAEEDVEIDLIHESGNHREHSASRNPAELERLAREIQADGLLQRIGVRDDGAGGFELIYGSRRLAAAKLIQWKEIPARIYPESLSPAEVENLRTVENVNRLDLTPAERALAVARMIETTGAEIGGENPNEGKAVSQAGGIIELVAQRLGREVAWVRDHAYVARLGGAARQMLADGRIDLGHARELAKLGSTLEQDRLAQDVERNADGTGGRSVVWLRKRVAETIRNLRGVPWRLDTAFEPTGMYPQLLADRCESCRFNSRSDPDLFEHDDTQTREAMNNPKAGTCLNSECFAARTQICAAKLESAVKSVVKSAAKSDETVTPAAVGRGDFGAVPSFLRPETVARKAVAQIQPAAAGSASGKTGTAADPVEAAKRSAKDRYEKQRTAWGIEVAKLIAEKMARVNGAKAMQSLIYDLLSDDLRRGGWYGYSDDRAAEKSFQQSNDEALREWNKPSTVRRLKYIAAPTLEAFAEVEKDLNTNAATELCNLVDPALLALAAAFGVKAPPPPDRDAMIAAALEKASAPATPPATAKKSAGKKRKAKTPPPADEEDSAGPSEAQYPDMEGES